MNKMDYDNPMRRNVFDVPALCMAQVAEIEKESRMMISTPEIFNIRRVIITGCGDSYIAGMAAKYAMEELAGVPAEVINAIDLARHICPDSLKGNGSTMVVAVSNSGMVSRIVEAVERVKKYGVLTVAVTGNAKSPLGQAAHKVLNLNIPPFEAGNGVRTYMIAMLSLISIAVRMGEVKGRYPMTMAEKYRSDICDYAAAYQNVLENLDDSMYEIALDNTDNEMYDFVASGPNLATAWFNLAKIQEATGDYTFASNSEDWMHGQCFLKNIDKIFTMVIASGGSNAQSRTQEVIDCMASMKRKLYVQADASGIIVPKKVNEIKIPSCPYEWMAPLLNYLPFSLLSGYLCELKQESYGRGCRGSWAVCGTTELITKSRVEIY